MQARPHIRSTANFAITLAICTAFLWSCAGKSASNNAAKSPAWTKLPSGLYSNGNGELGFKASRIVGPNETREDYFITKFNHNEGEALAKTVDTATFEDLGATFYRDKTHVYRF